MSASVFSAYIRYAVTFFEKSIRLMGTNKIKLFETAWTPSLGAA